VLICEGYTDVIALHQAGFANAVATCGTAVGAEHLRALARYTRRVVLAFDADRAGMQAAERAWEAVRELAGSGTTALDLSVLPLPEGRDPADLVRDVGAAGMRTAVADARPVVPFLIGARLDQADLTSEQGRVAALREALTVLGQEADPELRRAWARSEVARPLGLAYDLVVATAARQGIALDVVEGVATARVARPARRDASVAAPDPAVTDARLERAVLRVVLQAPDLLPPAAAELGVATFRHPSAAAVWRAIAGAGGPGAPMDAVLAAAEDDLVRDVVRGVLLEEDPAASADEPDVRRRAATDLVHRLVARDLAVQEQELRERLASVDAGGDPDGVLTLQRELQALASRRRALRGTDGA
jgi:DNA primase